MCWPSSYPSWWQKSVEQAHLFSIREGSGLTGLTVKQVHACEDLMPSLSSLTNITLEVLGGLPGGIIVFNYFLLLTGW